MTKTKTDPFDAIIAGTSRKMGMPEKMPRVLAALSPAARERVEQLMDAPRAQFSALRIAEIITAFLAHEGVEDSVSEGTVRKYRGTRGN